MIDILFLSAGSPRQNDNQAAKSAPLMAPGAAEPTKGGKVSLTGYESDILAEGLDVIFCGLNPAATAAASGHNFSYPSNRFWRVLHLAGFTEIQLQPQDERRLLEYRCGISAVVRRATRRAAEVSADDFKAARPEFEDKMRRFAPRAIAFLGKRALSAMLGLPKVEWGHYPPGFAGTMAWVLPNPSGLNRAFTLDALVEAYSELQRQKLSSHATASN
jgi:TDG/mug DNA glycosylase family protein